MLNETRFQQCVELVALDRNESLGQYAIDVAKAICEQYQQALFDTPTYYFCSNEKCLLHVPIPEDQKDATVMGVRVHHKNQVIMRWKFRTSAEDDSRWFCDACAAMIEQCDYNHEHEIHFEQI